MFAPAGALCLTPEQKVEIEAIVRNGSTPLGIATRCHALLLAGQGVANQVIAEQLGLSRPTVITVRSAFSHRGIAAITGPAPILPLRPGLPERQTHDYKRDGTTTLFAAFNTLNGKVIGSCLHRVCAFSQPIGKRTPARGGSSPDQGQLLFPQEC